jgi:uncharacterized membrane protein required for colicin V production
VADLLLIGFMAGFVRGGWTTGFIRRLFGLAFMAIAFVAGAYLRQPVGALLLTIFPDIPEAYADLIGYAAVFGVLTFGLNLFSKPFLTRFAVSGMSRMSDQVLGAVFGGIEAVLIASAGIVILHTYATPGSTIGTIANLMILPDLVNAIDTSTIGRLLEQTTVPVVLKVLGPLLPADITTYVPEVIPGGIPGFPTPGGIPGFPFPFPIPIPSTVP